MRREVDQAVQAIQARFGSQALTKAARLPAAEPWPSGLESLDRLSGIGGLPKGRISVLEGRETSGKVSLGLGLLAKATRELAHAVVLDPEHSFDPWALLPLEPDLEALTLVRPPDARALGEAATSLARAGAGFLLVLGCPKEADLATLEAAAARSGTVVVVVAELAPPALAHASSLSLRLERTGWVRERGSLVGLRARVRCVKNRLAPPLGESELEVRYPLGARLFFPRTLGEPAAAEGVEEEVTEAAGERVGMGAGEGCEARSAAV
jgi:recombination protein RecA